MRRLWNKTEILMTLLQQIRSRLNLKQKVVAFRADRSQGWVSKTENNPNPRIAAIAEYLNACGCEVSLSISRGPEEIERVVWRPNRSVRL